ncbi:MAG: DUF4845 domain-containing protein [Dehalococcoidia bacterium]|nr:DUF4845 domain-containing protein [Dehalococcoidia bacterium]
MWAIVIVAALLLGFKIGPAYMEYYTIRGQLRAIAEDPGVNTGLRRDVEAAFVRRATMENIRSIGPEDIQIAKEGDQLVLSADYSVRVPLFGNLSACMDFHATSRR